MRFHTILGIIVLTVACFKNDIRKLCWEEFTKNKLCFPKYEKCLISGREMIGCRDSFHICVKNGTVYRHTEFCNIQMTNLSNHPELTSEKKWLNHLLDEKLNYLGASRNDKSEKDHNCDLHDRLFKTMKIDKSNEFLIKMSSYASQFCPCREISDGFEAVRTSRMNIPIQMWHGGFSSKKCWREFDRFLVEFLCGESSTLEINHIWAKSADCHEDPNQKTSCRKSFDLSLKKSVKTSTIQATCQLYYEMLEAYLSSEQTPLSDYKITYINTSDLIYLQPFEYRHDRLYLMNSFEENTYFTCFTVKREVSSCNYMFEHCKRNEKSEKCGEKLIDCLSKTTAISSECKNLLVQRNDNIGTLDKIYHFVMNNKLQLAWPVILYIIWTLLKSIINWILLSIAIKICLKISELLDRWSDSIDVRIPKKKQKEERNEQIGLDPVYSTTIMITVPEFVDIPLDTEDGNNYNNDNNANEIPIIESEQDKVIKKEKEKEDFNFGQSFRKMIISLTRLIRSSYNFIEISIRNIL